MCEAGSDASQESLEVEWAGEKNRHRRLAADFEHFRKRTARESEARAAAQKAAFMRERLPSSDRLERAVASDTSTSPEGLREGVDLTLQPLRQLLRGHGSAAEGSLGQAFDPHRYEALGRRHDPSQPADPVLEIFQRVERRADELIRPAKVVVPDLSGAAATPHAG